MEFAILLPVFMTLILGMFSGGLAYNRQIALRNAAREGARWGATLREGAASWPSTVRDVVVERSEGELTAANVCVALVDQDLGDPVGSIADAPATHIIGTSAEIAQGYCYADSQDTGARVQVTVRSTANIEALVFSYNVNLTARASAKHEGLAASSG